MKPLRIHIIISLLVVLVYPVLAQDDEFMITFRHPAVGGYYVSAIYSNNQVFLPVAELFSLLYIHNEKGTEGFSMKGTFPDDTPWELNPSQLTARSGRQVFSLTSDDLRVGTMDIFLTPALFEQLFGLRFTADMSALILNLESDHPLPVEDRQRRDRLRRDLERRRADTPDYPLLYPRNRKLFSAGMLDYNFGISTGNSFSAFNYNLIGGVEFLGGDLQGALNGFVSNNNSDISAGAVNWRYAFRENPYLTAVSAGQLSTSGLLSNRIIGAGITNNPIIPRRIYDTYVIDGNTVPDSEVELYINNQLSDFTRADELGYYRFDYPLNYGTVRINTRIYTPSGHIIVEDKQLQIPFTFLPKGVVAYELQGGYLATDAGFQTSDVGVMHGDFAYGIVNGLTAKIGTDYVSSEREPLFYGSISARLFSQYLLNIDVAPENFYKANFGVTFANSRSINLNYAEFDELSHYNFTGLQREMGANFYLPVRLFGLYSGFRLGGEHRVAINNNQTTNYRFDFNSRVGRVNLRLNYRERLLSIGEGINTFDNSLATAALTYNFARTPGVPVFVRGMFARVQADYAVRNDEMVRAGIQLSRSYSSRGRFQVSMDYDFASQSTRFQGTLTLDLKPVRSSTQITTISDQYLFTQTFTGSVALDAARGKLLASNRNQVRQSAASIRFFVDANENGTYDRGEELVPTRAIRIDQGATITLGNDSIVRLSQLQSYWRYNAEIVQSALPNPTLAPLITEFSFVADPNRHKPIDIPLYRTGVIEGMVKLDRGDQKPQGIGGVRIFLKSQSRNFEETLRTFSDGGFYAMNLLPGTYTLEVDPVQLSFLSANSQPEKITFEIKALSTGDYIEGLNILIVVR